jgi:hypothetical protein
MARKKKVPAETTKNAQPEQSVVDRDPMPADIDEFRFEVVRRIHTFLNFWRDCNRPRCKRARACRGSAPFSCTRGKVPVTKKATARAAAKFYYLLQRELAKREVARATSAAAGQRTARVTR